MGEAVFLLARLLIFSRCFSVRLFSTALTKEPEVLRQHGQLHTDRACIVFPAEIGRISPVSASKILSAGGLPSSDRSSDTSAPVGASDAVSSTRKASSTTTIAAPPARPGTYSFVVAGTNFQIDEKYKFIKVIGRGAYGVVM